MWTPNAAQLADGADVKDVYWISPRQPQPDTNTENQKSAFSALAVAITVGLLIVAASLLVVLSRRRGRTKVRYHAVVAANENELPMDKLDFPL